jgi:hypothetical protein
VPQILLLTPHVWQCMSQQGESPRSEKRQLMAVCKKCAKENLVWRQSKKGNWYLSEPATISTKSAYKNITIPFAHRCQEVVGNERNESFMFDLQPRSGA